MRGLITLIHLPLSAANMVYLPLVNNSCTMEQILQLLRLVDTTHKANGQKGFGYDLWWYIRGYIRAWETPIVSRFDNVVDEELVNDFRSLWAV